MQSPRFSAVGLSLSLALLSGCGAPDDSEVEPTVLTSEDGEFKGEFRLGSDPAQTGETTLSIVLYAADEPVVDAQIAIDLWMPIHGHISPVEPQVMELGEGHYLAEQVVLDMPGRWECNVEVRAAGHVDRFVVSRVAR